MIEITTTEIRAKIIAIFLARDPQSSVFRIVSFAWAGFGACFGPIMLLALFSKRTNLQGAIAGMIAGAVMIFVWKFGVRPTLNIYELLPAFLVNLVVTFVVSQVTPAPSEEIQKTFDEVMEMV